MKKLFLSLFLIVFVLSSGAFAAGKTMVVDRDVTGPSFVGNAENKCVVIFKEGAPPVRGNQALADIAQRFQVGRFARQFPAAQESHPVDRPLTRYYKAHFPPGNLDKVMEAYRNLPFVERVEPIGIFRLTATPNDFHYDDSTGGFPYTQWHYWDTYGVNADSAWDLETGSSDVIIAVPDAGVKYDHFELGGTDPPGPADNVTNGNIWVNDGEIPGNGQDDDNNGYVDDVIGWDFVESASQCNDADCSVADNDPRDGVGHGTHVAGTIAAITNNYADWGVAGIAGGWNDGTTNYTATGVRIMCLRIGWNSPLGGFVGMDYAAEAFYYVATMVDKGYNIAAINCSWGSSSLLSAATDAVLARDVMVIVAAGNSNSSSCDYLGCRTDCLDVGGTQRNGNPYASSNYGSWVDIAAPAVNVLSTYTDPGDPTGDYIALMTGTSMACPHVVGVAALLESYAPSLTGPEKFAIITDSVNTKPYNRTKYVGVGIVDARKCLDAAQVCDITADFAGAPTSGCVPLTVNFTDQSTGPVISWQWYFGDGGSSTGTNPSHQYTTPGNFDVTLIVCSATCCDTITKTNYVTVGDVPVADFSGSPTLGPEPLDVDFTDLSTGNPTDWEWDFGDGTPHSFVQNPSHTYNDPGDYTVTLTATNACGSDGETKINYIHVDSSAVSQGLALSDIPVIGTVSGNYSYTHSSDNSYESITEVEYTGHPVKRYSYLEHKWDFNVASGGSNMMFYVEAYRPNNTDGDNFVFAYSTDDATYIDLVTVASATEQVYSASLPAGLTGTIYIRVRDTNRSWGNISLDPVYVDQMYIQYESTPGPPVAEFSGSPRSGPAPLSVDFTDLSTGNPTAWDWDFGDGTPHSYDQHPTHIYSANGDYTVTLIASNAYGSDPETKVDYIRVGAFYSHVHNMVVSRIKVGANNKGTCTVTVYDQDNQPLSSATVYVSYDGPNSGSLNGVTGGDGTVYFETSPIKKPVGEWCFEVTNITHATHTYDPGSNSVTRACESGWVYGEGAARTQEMVPEDYSLDQNHPNPFNPTTEISFSLPTATQITLEIFNILGQRVAIVADGSYRAGRHTITWDASQQSSGIYFYRLTTFEFTATKKMLLLK